MRKSYLTMCPICRAEGITEEALSSKQVEALNAQIHDDTLLIVCDSCELLYVRRPLRVSWVPILQVVQ